MVGAAVATVVSRYFNFISLGIMSKRILDIVPASSSIYKPLVSSLAMVAFLYFMPGPDTVLIGVGEILIAGVVYLSILILLRGIGREDLRYFREIFGV